MPDDCGSTRPSTICAATVASMALPPSASICNAAWVASGCAVLAATGWGVVAMGLVSARGAMAGGVGSVQPANTTHTSGARQLKRIERFSQTTGECT